MSCLIEGEHQRDCGERVGQVKRNEEKAHVGGIVKNVTVTVDSPIGSIEHIRNPCVPDIAQLIQLYKASHNPAAMKCFFFLLMWMKFWRC